MKEEQEGKIIKMNPVEICEIFLKPLAVRVVNIDQSPNLKMFIAENKNQSPKKANIIGNGTVFSIKQ